MMASVLDILRARGHRVDIVRDPARVPDGDLLILHVDASVVPPEYLGVAARFPATINAGVPDITKRRMSSLLVGPESDWDGPVIVKSDLNSGGSPEDRINFRARLHLRRAPYPGLRVVADYTVHAHLSEVPPPVWRDDALIVERFVPERTAEGYACRTYIFCGEAERCAIQTSEKEIVKGHTIRKTEPAEVPAALREMRRRMGFDYGKFDFVLQDGVPVIFDANKTPSGVLAKGPLRDRIAAGNEALADGVEGFLPVSLRVGSG